jgi:hypothetical protein
MSRFPALQAQVIQRQMIASQGDRTMIQNATNPDMARSSVDVSVGGRTDVPFKWADFRV